LNPTLRLPSGPAATEVPIASGLTTENIIANNLLSVGGPYSDGAAGIAVQKNASPIISYNTIRDNVVAYGVAGGIGLALNIVSDLALIEPCLDEVDYVQCMGIVRIGRQGQPLDQRIFERVRLFRRRHPDIPVQVDGGISLADAKKLVALGVSNLVIGSGILRAGDLAAAFVAFEALQSPYGV